MKICLILSNKEILVIKTYILLLRSPEQVSHLNLHSSLGVRTVMIMMRASGEDKEY